MQSNGTPLKSQHETCMNNTEKLSAKISGVELDLLQVAKL